MKALFILPFLLFTTFCFAQKVLTFGDCWGGPGFSAREASARVSLLLQSSDHDYKLRDSTLNNGLSIFSVLRTPYQISSVSPGIVTADMRPTISWQLGSGSTQFHPIDTLECGIDTCAHDLVHSKPWQMGNPNISCLVNHPPGFYCNYGNAHQRRKSICRKCCFHILESDEYIPPATPPAPAIEPEDEYEKLVKKQ